MGPLSGESAVAECAGVSDAGSSIIACFDHRCLDAVGISRIAECADIAANFVCAWVVGNFFFCADAASIRDAHASLITYFDFSSLDAVGVSRVAHGTNVATYFVCTWVVSYLIADVAGVGHAEPCITTNLQDVGFYAV